MDPGRKAFTARHLGSEADAICLDRLTLHERMPPFWVRRPLGTPGQWLLIHFHDPAWLRRDGAILEVPAESLVIWPPERPHELGNRERGWDHSWCFVRGSAMAELVQASAVPTEQAIVFGSARLTDQCFAACYEEMHREQVDAEIIRLQLALLLRQAARAARREPQPDQDRLLTVLRFIDAHLVEDLSLERLARVADWSPSHFSARFRERFGLAPGAYVLQQRLQAAQYLLQDPTLPVAEVAQRSGFGDPFHFSRSFKRHLGCSPRAWRQRLFG